MDMCLTQIVVYIAAIHVFPVTRQSQISWTWSRSRQPVPGSNSQPTSSQHHNIIRSQWYESPIVEKQTDGSYVQTAVHPHVPSFIRRRIYRGGSGIRTINVTRSAGPKTYNRTIVSNTKRRKPGVRKRKQQTQILSSTRKYNRSKHRGNTKSLISKNIRPTFKPNGKPKAVAHSHFTPAEKAAIVEFHNKARREVVPGASNMREMEWDEGLGNVAQRYADRCLGVHNPHRHTQQTEFSLLGENMYHTWDWSIVDGQKTPEPLNVTRAMDMWFEERKYYNFNWPENCPVSKCGHYTQMVRAVSHAVGCGKHFCSRVVFKSRTLTDVFVLVCNYGEGYNNKPTPYEAGRACSKCVTEFPVCRNGLCRKKQN